MRIPVFLFAPIILLTGGVSAGEKDISGVKNFLYQLVNLDLVQAGATAFDLIITDYSSDGSEYGELTRDQVQNLKHGPGGRKIVLSYLSIGEAEDYRFYWQPGWKPGDPAWLGPENPDWEGNFKVRYWDPGWQAVIFSYLDRILAAGFDGVYLDIIDAYEYWEEKGRTGAAREMTDWVAAIADRGRTTDPDFLIFVQNAAELGGIFPEHIDTVDGIGQEDIYFGYDSDGVATPADVTSRMEDHLNLFKNAGKTVLTIDYPFSDSEDIPHFDAGTRGKIDSAYARSARNGFVPYCTVRNLSFLTVNPGHEPVGPAAARSEDRFRDFTVYPNFPNPFNESTVFPFFIPAQAEVRVGISDVRGGEMAVLFDPVGKPGRGIIRWDGRDKRGRPAAAGVYLVQINAGGFKKILKISLIR
ncbi:endo alpha-1,4 polygalactosaminidase [bacterium]|nr:endo alpha-1,4 polygalactosaminidase [bacterium]